MRVLLASERKFIFFGLGRSGFEYNFSSKTSSFILFGRPIKTLKKEKEKAEEKPKKVKEKPKKAKPKRKRPLKDIIRIIPKSSKALFHYLIGLLKAVVVEELDGDIKAGFESPDLTGRIFGYYQAAYYAVPAVVGRINYQPVWNETAFEAKMKASVAIPMYKIVYRSIILIFSLPLRDIIKVTIGRKERSHDG